MAKRRMFSKEIMDSDVVIDLTATQKVLYLYMNLNADDDGFVNSLRIIKTITQSTDEDLDVLAANGLVIKFFSGICVIRHWRIHNQIQKDRYHPTIYQKELNLLNISEEGTYELKEYKQSSLNVYKMDTECIQNVSSV